MFTGRFTVKLDQKGRIILAAKLKNQMIQTYGHEYPHLVLAPSFYQPCLLLMSETQWDAIGSRPAVDLLNPVVMDGFRLMSQVSYLTYDEVGRIVIPDYLKDYAGIQDQVALLGCRSYIELWNPEAADRHLRELQARAPEIMNRLRAELSPVRTQTPAGGGDAGGQ